MNSALPSWNQQQHRTLTWSGLTGAGLSLALQQLNQQLNKPILVITPTAQLAQQLYHELNFFTPNSALIFPDWETLPYDRFSPHQDIISARLEALYRQSTQPPRFLIAQVSSLMHRLIPAHYVLRHSFVLHTHQHCNRQTFVNQLTANGYQRVTQVMEHGEYALRGALLDVFPMGAQAPLRIDWLDDEVDTIRVFDINSQLTQQQLQEITLLPAKEYPLDEASIHHFRQQWRATFDEQHTRQNRLYQSVSQGHSTSGLEYYLPLFFDQLSSITDYLSTDTHIALVDDIVGAAQDFYQEITERYQLAKLDTQHPVLPPDRIFLSSDTLLTHLKPFYQIKLQTQPDVPTQHWSLQTLPDLSVDSKRSDSLWRLTQWLPQVSAQYRILFVVESLGRREMILALLKQANITPIIVHHWHEFTQQTTPGIYITVANIQRNLWLDDTILISENSLYTEYVQQTRRRKQNLHADFNDSIRSLAELEVGDAVVHAEHGVGRFIGLEVISLDQVAREFVTLEYAGGDKLYIPITNLSLISRYTGADRDHAPWHKLGNDRWQKARKQAAEKIKDVAVELLDLYAKREAQVGHAFTLANADYQRFSADFTFETTPDQQTAIDAVLTDMQSNRPMDRLVCGDVGFGKTEVAMRAAFVAVQGGKQVILLVPTTLLANQHLQSFRDRFADWPVRIEVLSRFVGSTQQQSILSDIATGKVDIIIGTHKLLQGNIRYHDLGLIIIDEEHRFGVKHKEFLKRMRTQVDILTMTATPIPRTLSMAFSQLRDMSIIATPPAKRQSIQTFVQPWNNELAKEACSRELRRGGQVYILYNDVAHMPAFSEEIQQLLPHARLAMAHGQMPKHQLERVMRDFYHQQYNILICSTIIETGIDIPNANTILIVRADQFGLAQLHQLRGRVGRSHHKAYAYLFTPPKEALSAEAIKRLEAIARHDQLGSGFAIASQDLEIRGAGELLGHEQSGQMHEIGFELYTQLLDKTIRAYRQGKLTLTDEDDINCEIDLGIAALIPDDYLPDMSMRLLLYKRINSSHNQAELDQLHIEMIDRFGLLPDATQRLFQMMEIKIQAQALGICKIEGNAQQILLHFISKPMIDPVKLIQLIQQQPKNYKLEGANKLKYLADMPKPEQRITQLINLIKQLANENITL